MVVREAVVDERAVVAELREHGVRAFLPVEREDPAVGGSTAVALNTSAERLRLAGPDVADGVHAGRLAPRPAATLTGIGEKLFWAVTA